MDKNLNITILMDFYGQLLTKKQIDALNYYYNEDLSLSEIGEILGISRQGAHDFIKRGEKQLLEYENELNLASRFRNAKDKIKSIKLLAQSISDSEDIKNKIIILSDDILNDF